jgi:predicted nucleic acid-binding protein
MKSAIVVADTSVLINFLRIDRMDLIGHHPQRFLATDHVEAEITSDYPEQRARYQTAIASGLLDTCSVTDPDEVALFLQLRPGERLGAGECSALPWPSTGGTPSQSTTAAQSDGRSGK